MSQMDIVPSDNSQQATAAYRLEELRTEISDRLVRTAMDIYHIGRALLEARDLIQHGAWGDWLHDNFDMSPDTAENWMNIAERIPVGMVERHVGPKTILYLLAKASTPDTAIQTAAYMVENGITLSREQAKEVVENARLVEKAPPIMRERVAAGALALNDAAAILRASQNVSQSVAAFCIFKGVRDPKVMQMLNIISRTRPEMYSEIISSGTLQGTAGDAEPIPIEEANVRDVSDVVAEERWETRMRNYRRRRAVDWKASVRNIDGKFITIELPEALDEVYQGFEGRFIIEVDES